VTYLETVLVLEEDCKNGKGIKEAGFALYVSLSKRIFLINFPMLMPY